MYYWEVLKSKQKQHVAMCWSHRSQRQRVSSFTCNGKLEFHAIVNQLLTFCSTKIACYVSYIFPPTSCTIVEKALDIFLKIITCKKCERQTWFYISHRSILLLVGVTLPWHCAPPRGALWLAPTCGAAKFRRVLLCLQLWYFACAIGLYSIARVTNTLFIATMLCFVYLLFNIAR